MKEFDTYSTYKVDYELFEELNLEKFSEITNWESIKVGNCEISNCKVEIWVQGCPAQFWTFNIEFEIGKKKISTGSGALNDYWKSIEDICSGCLIVEDYA